MPSRGGLGGPSLLAMLIASISPRESQLAAPAPGQIIEPAVTIEQILKGQVPQRSPAPGEHVRQMRADYPKGGIIRICRSRYQPLL